MIEYHEQVTPELMILICKRLQAGIPFADCCIINDVRPSVGKKWLEESEEFARLVRKTVSTCKGILIQNIHSGENAMGCRYLLEQIFSDEYGISRAPQKQKQIEQTTPAEYTEMEEEVPY